MKKIVHIIDGLDIGGAERLLVDLVTRLDKTAFDVQVVWLTQDRDALVQTLQDSGIRTTCIPKKSKIGWQVYRDLKKFLVEEKPDIVHTHLFAADTWGTLAARAAGVQHIVSTEHNIDRDQSALKTRVKARARKRAQRVVAVSEAVKKATIAVYGSNLASRTVVIPNAIDTQKFAYTTERHNPQPVVAVIGRLEEQKGHSLLLRALRLVRSACTVRIIGNGSLRQQLVARTNKLGLGDWVAFEPAQTDIQEVYRNSDIVVVPSRWEGFGLVAVEAMASGCAVIASNVDGLPEIISSGVNGVLVDIQQREQVAAAIDQLIADPVLRVQMARAGQQSVQERFDIAPMVRAYTDMYNSL